MFVRCSFVQLLQFNHFLFDRSKETQIAKITICILSNFGNQIGERGRRNFHFKYFQHIKIFSLAERKLEFTCYFLVLE